MLCVAEPHVPVTVLGYSLCRVPQGLCHTVLSWATHQYTGIWYLSQQPPQLLKCLWILSQHTCVQVCRCVWSDCDIVECGEGTLPFPSFSSIFLWGYGEWRGISSPFSCVVISFPVEFNNDVPWIFQTAHDNILTLLAMTSFYLSKSLDSVVVLHKFPTITSDLPFSRPFAFLLPSDNIIIYIYIYTYKC